MGLPSVDIETLHLSFLKRVLKVRKSTSNYIVYFELGRFPLYINRYCRMLKYWFKILKTEKFILKNCYEDMFESSVFKSNDKLNWGCKIRDILCKYDLIMYGCHKMLLMKIYLC